MERRTSPSRRIAWWWCGQVRFASIFFFLWRKCLTFWFLQKMLRLGSLFGRFDNGPTRITWQQTFGLGQFRWSCIASSVSDSRSWNTARTVWNVFWNTIRIRGRVSVLSVVFRNNQRPIPATITSWTNETWFTWQIFTETSQFKQNGNAINFFSKCK